MTMKDSGARQRRLDQEAAARAARAKAQVEPQVGATSDAPEVATPKKATPKKRGGH